MAISHKNIKIPPPKKFGDPAFPTHYGTFGGTRDKGGRGVSETLHGVLREALKIKKTQLNLEIIQTWGGGGVEVGSEET